MILPGSTLGLLGGGQLGRMFTQAARRMGYRVAVLDPDPDSPAGRCADEHLCAPYDDPQALNRIATTCAAVTTEFENLPATALDRLASERRVQPSARALRLTQERIREKQFIRDTGLPTADYAVVRTETDLHAALDAVGLPAILKRAAMGYDGKGQARIENPDQALAAYRAWGEVPCVLEARLTLDREISVVLARGDDGASALFPVVENQHLNGILHLSIAPARIADGLADQARDMALRLAEALDYCGVMAVEFFIDRSGRLLVNEIAPRPHNSGHYTLDACVTSQFEQQVRALCGLPLGSARQLTPVVMVNLLGDLWAKGPAWDAVLCQPNARLHLYGKQQARPGRKMGHFCVLNDDLEAALSEATAIHAALSGEPVPGSRAQSSRPS